MQVDLEFQVPATCRPGGSYKVTMDFRDQRLTEPLDPVDVQHPLAAWGDEDEGQGWIARDEVVEAVQSFLRLMSNAGVCRSGSREVVLQVEAGRAVDFDVLVDDGEGLDKLPFVEVVEYTFAETGR